MSGSSLERGRSEGAESTEDAKNLSFAPDFHDLLRARGVEPPPPGEPLHLADLPLSPTLPHWASPAGHQVGGAGGPERSTSGLASTLARPGLRASAPLAIAVVALVGIVLVGWKAAVRLEQGEDLSSVPLAVSFVDGSELFAFHYPSTCRRNEHPLDITLSCGVTEIRLRASGRGIGGPIVPGRVDADFHLPEASPCIAPADRAPGR
jgi:hypothetical protein